MEKEFELLDDKVKRDVKHTLLRNIWKGKDMSHCSELFKLLDINLFKDKDKKNNSTFEIVLNGGFSSNGVNPISVLKTIYERYFPDEKHDSDESRIKSFISSIG
jgi:hypothetical protein